jgi:hypothetical protein
VQPVQVSLSYGRDVAATRVPPLPEADGLIGKCPLCLTLALPSVVLIGQIWSEGN